MEPTYDRRAFLRRAGIAALGAPCVSVLGCTLERQQRDGEDEGATGPERPILLPWGPNAVRIAAPPAERPVAYMSIGRMQIWVDLGFRDRLRFALDAHISVSTAHWRVPLPGDPSTIPIQPGDALREFEEIDMREWDATLDPTEGDVRVLRGSAVARETRISCQPLSGGGVWFNAGPWNLLECGPPNGELCREDLMEVGTGQRFTDRDCTRPAGSVRFLTWACREPATLAGV